MIVSELCQNHNGDINLLKDMVKVSKDCGAWACKIQTFFAEDLSDEFKHDYDRMKSLELSWEAHQVFIEECIKNNIVPMTSVYSLKYFPKLWTIGFRNIKIGSAQCTDINLIRGYIETGFNVFLSTGGHFFKDVPKLYPISCVFHCVSKYPSQPYEANLSRIYDIKKYYPGVPVGFSDHTDPLHKDWAGPAMLASFLGCTYIEKHFTLLGRDKTKDGTVSIDRKQLEQLCLYDKLSFDEKLDVNPHWGMFYNKQSEEEKDLIKRYKNRWKEGPTRGDYETNG